MAPQKLPKNMLANKHLLVRGKQKKFIHSMAKLLETSVSDIVESMIEDYLEDTRGLLRKEFKQRGFI